ncbi:MAG: type I restriction endonuclease, partial [Vagococcus sp.]
MAIMELFQNERYTYTNGEEIHKELADVLLRDDLKTYLHSRYVEQGITSLEVENAIARLTANVGQSVYENNVAIYRLITEGFSLKREDSSQTDLFIEPIDFDRPENNIFRIVNQLEIKGTEKRIPDG